MTTHAFTLVVAGPDLQEPSRLDALFEAGCDDATFGRQSGLQIAEFDREAESLADAVRSAVVAIEKTVEGARVFAVQPSEFVTQAAIAERIGRTRESVRLLIEGRRGPGNFPAPLAVLADTRPVYAWTLVVRWLAEYDRTIPRDAVESADVLAAMNDALSAAASDEASKRRRALARRFRHEIHSQT